MTRPQIVVSDSGPLISLAKVKKFHFLKDFFGKVCIPEAVYDEVVTKGRGGAGESETKEALTDWIEKVSVKDHLAVQILLSELGHGEAESIVLAKEMNAGRLLVDDKDASIKSKSLGIKTAGTLDITITAYKLRIIENLKDALDELRRKGFYLDDCTYEQTLADNP